MSNANIEKLLVAQKIDKERLQMIQGLEKGKVKMELDKANQTINNSKASLLQLESDAKTLQDNYQKIAKIVADTLAQVDKANTNQSEDLELYSNYLSKLSMLESQLSDIERRIGQKSAAFKTTTVDVAKASAVLKNISKKYEDAKGAGAPKIQALEQQFNDKVQGVDEKLLAKYRAVRKSKGSDTKDVVVPLTVDNRCQGCYMEVPVAMINKIKTDGWTTCDECGRIIYQA
ncbi:MAG: C4-type zinc ribbon domain-containing protein [Prevotella sp.]|nr:C4-type zinc ribbon domain-containing protein [Prevotella sp.]